MGAILPVLGIIMIISLIGFLVYYDGYGGVTTATFNNFMEETTKFSDGSFITILIEDQPESVDSTPVTQQIVTDEQGNQTIEEVPVEEIIAPQKGISQYSKTDPKGIEVQGYIILTDEITGQPIKPYEYSALIEIQCDDDLNLQDGFNFCTTSPVFGRVQTTDGGKDSDGIDQGGFFYYKWRPHNSASTGFYDIKIIVISASNNQFGQYAEYEKSYKIQVID